MREENVSGSNEAIEYIETRKPHPDWTLAKDGVDNILSIDSNAILEAIALLEDSYGGVEAYLTLKVGLSPSDVAAIRNNLVFSP